MNTNAMNKFAVSCSCLALLGCVTVTSAFAEEVDITKVVREAGKGTTTLKVGSSNPNFSVINAFGNLETLESRIMLKNYYNVINWDVADDFEEGRPIVLTKYTLRRATSTGTVPGDSHDGYSCRRAPSEFRLQGSLDASTWVTIDEQMNVNWGDTGNAGPMEMTFEVKPLGYNDFRHFRLVVDKTKADDSDGVHCSFQYVKLFGTVGDYGTLAAAARPLESLVLKAVDADKGPSAYVPEYTPTLDSKIEIDLALDSTNGSQAIVISGWGGSSAPMRLFHTAAAGWTYNYGPGSTSIKSGVKAYPGTRYQVTVDGSKVSVNGVQIIDAGVVKTATADTALCLFASPVDDKVTTVYNHASVRFYGLKAWKSDGTLALDLRPVVAGDGTGRLQDAITKKLYATREHANGVPLDFDVHKWQNDLSCVMRTDKDNPTEPVVTLVEGEAVDGYPVTNAFSWGVTTASRALFRTAHNVIQYDIPDGYHEGRPIVLARYTVIPPSYTSLDDTYGVDRAPLYFELQASKDGANDWVTLSKVEGVGSDPGAYKQKGCKKETVNNKDYYVYYGSSFEIPEEKRGDYRHYRFITEKSSAGSSDSVKVGFQEVRLFGYDGGFEMACEPIEYAQNASGSQSGNNTYFKTGVIPTACNLAIEMKGSFTKVDKTGCLFCSRDANAGKSWSLFLNGDLRLHCDTSRTESKFKPVAGKVYTIRVVQNKLYVDGELICTSGATSFVPGSEIVLLASHKAASSSWDNQAQFKLQSCKITDIYGGVIRDYVAVKRSDGTVGLVERANQVPNSNFLGASGTAALGGEPIDTDFWQRDRGVTMTTESEDGALPKERNVSFAFLGNQRLSAELYAAFDDAFRGNSTNDWAEIVKIADVKTGIGTLDVTLPKTDYRYVKFFVCDKIACGISHTKSCKTRPRSGLMILVR